MGQFAFLNESTCKNRPQIAQINQDEKRLGKLMAQKQTFNPSRVAGLGTILPRMKSGAIYVKPSGFW